MRQLETVSRAALRSDYVRDQLLDYISKEDDAEQKEIIQSYNLTLQERVTKNICMRNLQFQFRTTNGRLVFKYKSHEELCFEEGSYLVLNSELVNGYRIRKGAVMQLLEIDYSNTYLTFSMLHEPENVSTNISKNVTYMLDRSYSDETTKALKQAVHKCFEPTVHQSSYPDMIKTAAMEPVATFHLSNQRGQQLRVAESPGGEELSDLAALVLGGRRLHPSAPARKIRDTPDGAEETSAFTVRQKQAYELAAKSPLTLIQGPPGTGKTRLLAQIIARAVRQNKSVLVTAYTHAAINNLLTAVYKILKGEYPIYKVATSIPSQMPSKGIELLSLSSRDINAVMEEPIVLGATVFQAHSFNHIKANSFDLLIVDEGGQMPVAHAVAAMACSNRFVVAGDPRQLPPIEKVPTSKYDLSRSILEHLLKLYPQQNIELDITFRMNSEINEFPSQHFYAGNLKSAKASSNRKFTPLAADCDPYNLFKRSEAVTFIEVKHTTSSLVSTKEADAAARIAFHLITQQGLAPAELAIITPFNKQRKEIRQRLRRLLATQLTLEPLKTLKEISIGTVDKMQGQEREVVILSLCASDPSFLRSRQKFLYQPNRLNVAITRCKSRLFVIASKNFFPRVGGIKIDPAHARLFDEYYEYLQDKTVVFGDHDCD